MTEFEVACISRVGQLRTALIELYDNIGADPTKPQDVARKLKVNKTLAWNVARLLQASDELSAVTHVPGASSLEKVIQATVKHGADAGAVSLARDAVHDFHSMIRDHAGDRPTLDLIIDGAGSESANRLELSRKLAFRGNSGIYGIQAKTRVVTNFLAPNPHNPDRLDMAHITGYIDFRRLRGNVRWPIFMKRVWGQMEESGAEPIEPSEDAKAGIPVINSATRGCKPVITPVDSPEGRDFYLAEGPIGNEGAFDCFWGEVTRSAAARYGDHAGDVGEFGSGVTVPVEKLVMDIIVDRDLQFALRPELFVFGRIVANGNPTGDANDPSLLPIKHGVIPLSGSPPLVNTPHVPNYAKLVNRVYERIGWDPTRFQSVRLVLEYPPLGANVILRFPLPEK